MVLRLVRQNKLTSVLVVIALIALVVFILVFREAEDNRSTQSSLYIQDGNLEYRKHIKKAQTTKLEDSLYTTETIKPGDIVNYKGFALAQDSNYEILNSYEFNFFAIKILNQVTLKSSKNINALVFQDANIDFDIIDGGSELVFKVLSDGTKTINWSLIVDETVVGKI